jgi:DNA polymerase III delta subunit
MLVLFSGSDRGLVRDGASSYINKNIASGKSVHNIEGGDFEAGKIKNALGATSLFGESEWYVLDEPSSNPDFSAEVGESLVDMAESTNNFVILEGKLLAAAKKQYVKVATEVFEFNVGPKDKHNPFGLAEALSNKDKKKLWVLLQEARLNGMRDEEIVGILWWQLKTLRLAKLTGSASEAGIKDFPYNKAKRSLSKFSQNEVEDLSQSLLALYHRGHAGVGDMEVNLERWVLGLG